MLLGHEFLISALFVVTFQAVMSETVLVMFVGHLPERMIQRRFNRTYVK